MTCKYNGCTGLTSFTIGRNVKSIGVGAFLGTNLTTVTSLISNPYEVDEKVFFNKNDHFTTAILYVPKGTKAKYEATPAWNKFRKIVEKVLRGDVNDDGAVDVADIAVIIDTMAKGSNDAEADVNKDTGVDVADIATVIDIMAGKTVDIPEEKAYTTCPDGNHPHWIDLGLPSGTKWACCNEGASKPEDYGEYYTFSEAAPYNPPSLDQIHELLDNTTSEWTTENRVNGRRFTGPNGGYVFLPAAGYYDADTDQLQFIGDIGYFWSSTPYDDDNANGLAFSSGGADSFYDYGSYCISVRPVR